MQGYEQLSGMVQQILQYNYQNTTAKVARAKESINTSYQRIAAAYDWPQLLRADESGLRDPSDANLATIKGGEAEAPMPLSMGRLKSIQLQTPGFATGQLEAMDMQDFYDRIGHRFGIAGVPRIYTVVGMTAQTRRAQTDGLTPTLRCNVASNDNIRTVRIYYRKDRAVGIDQQTSVTLSGIFSTGVSLGQPIGTGYPIERVVLEQGWVGNAIISDGTDDLVSIQHIEEPVTTATNQRIVHTRQLIRVWPVPDVSYPATLMWQAKPRPLTEDEDTPEMPVSEYLIQQGIADLLKQEGRHKDATDHVASANDMFRQLTKQNKQDASRRMTPRGRSFLGQTGVWDW